MFVGGGVSREIVEASASGNGRRASHSCRKVEHSSAAGAFVHGVFFALRGPSVPSGLPSPKNASAVLDTIAGAGIINDHKGD